MALTEELVREELKKVIDPELFVNIVDLGLIYTVNIEMAGETAAPEATPEAVEATSEAAEAKPEAAEAKPEAAEATAEQADENAAETGEEKSDANTEGNSDANGMTKVGIEMTLTSPMCPAGPQLVAQSRQVVEAIDGVGEVEVKIVMDPPWSQERMTDDARDQLGIF